MKQGKKVGLKLVVKSVFIEKFKSGHSLRGYINRKTLIHTEATEKNKVGSTDITYIPDQQGWSYLSTL